MGRLVAVDADRFALAFWDRRWLLTRSCDLPAPFTDLMSAATVDSLVAERGLRQPFFRVVADTAPVGNVTRSVVAGNRTVTDIADTDAVARAYGDGGTLVLQSLHRLWPPVGAFCRDLATELGHQTQCNAYITPAGNAQGFAYHHDTHDVFVLQIEGSKLWHVYPPVLALPARDQTRSGPTLVAEGQKPLLEVVLEAGDTLYLPRGYIHAARTTDRASVHLTVGVVPTTWLDLLKDVVAVLGAEHLPLRGALPARPADVLDEPEAAGELLALASEWLGSLEPGQIGELVRRRSAKTVGPEPLGVIAQSAAAASVTGASWVRRRRDLPCRQVTGAHRVSLLLADKRITLPLAAAVLLETLLAGPATTPAAAVQNDPDCDVDDAVVVVARLLREGVLVPTAALA